MRFERIGLYLQNEPNALTDGVANLIDDFDVVAYSRCPSIRLSELERLLKNGRSVERRDDFYDVPGSWHGQVIDHASVFKCNDGHVFMLTMPYNTERGFYRDFERMMHGYRRARRHFAHDLVSVHNEQTANRWAPQFVIPPMIEARIVPERYRTRDNGDLVAIIATTGTFAALDEIVPDLGR